MNINRQELDNYITGHYGEDQFADYSARDEELRVEGAQEERERILRIVREGKTMLAIRVEQEEDWDIATWASGGVAALREVEKQLTETEDEQEPQQW